MYLCAQSQHFPIFMKFGGSPPRYAPARFKRVSTGNFFMNRAWRVIMIMVGLGLYIGQTMSPDVFVNFCSIHLFCTNTFFTRSQFQGCGPHIQQQAAAIYYNTCYTSSLIAAAFWLQPVSRTFEFSNPSPFPIWMFHGTYIKPSQVSHALI